MENLKDILIDMSSPEEEQELLERHLEGLAKKAMQTAAKTIKGEKGDMGLKPTKEELEAIIKPLIPKPSRGEQGLRGFRGEKGDTGGAGKDGTSVELKEVIDAVMPSIISRLPGRGGSMNRQIYIGGVDPLTRYTDINLKAGANITLSYVNNDITKKVDVTITASGGGGGGSVSGIIRSINPISTSQSAGNASGTDYVYICSAGIQVTLPDATAGNTNLYTIKNTSSSSVLVSTTSAQTIDGQSNAILATQFTSIDIESDGTNWQIT